MSGKPYPSTSAQARRPLGKRGKATPPDYPIDASEALRIAGRYPKPRSAELGAKLGERKRMTLAIATAMSKKIEQLTAIEHET